MAALQHVYRRGNIFWWRRIHRLFNGISLDVRLSLRTVDRLAARNRGAALTAASGGVLEMLNHKAKADDARPTEDELQAIAKIAYDELLTELCTDQRSAPYLRDGHSSSNLAFADYYQRLTNNGGHASLLPAEERVLAETWEWDQQRIADLRHIIQLREEKGHTRIQPAAIDRWLREFGHRPDDMSRWMVELVLYPAYRDAHLVAEQSLWQSAGPPGVARDVLPPSMPVVPPVLFQPAAAAPGHVDPAIPAEWRQLTATQAAERMIAATPLLFEHRKNGKRAAAQTGEQTLRQIRWAAVLLERSMEGRPLWTLTEEDMKTLDEWFDKLPTNCGKSEWDRQPQRTLEEICIKAEDQIEAGEQEADIIGLTAGTSNKHFRKLRQIHVYMREKVPVAELPFGKFISPDIKDERAARAAYTVEQGKELFSLPPWSGSLSVKDRLEPGRDIYHDSLFFVLLLVWYTGMRREEVCKLLITDVQVHADIWHISIATTEAGRVKNASSVRLMAICEEVLRLGFIQYVDAIKAAGHDAVFPELVSERKRAKKGDTFYKLWWIYIKPLMTSLQRGQALHAARHMVSTELKELEVFPEFRDDALGHKGEGEGQSRYSKATRLRKLKELVDQIPVVTDHISNVQEIRLLPAAHRKPRPRRVREEG